MFVHILKMIKILLYIFFIFYAAVLQEDLLLIYKKMNTFNNPKTFW